MQFTAIFAVAENTFYKGTRDDGKKVRGVRIIFRNLCLNISENACNRAFLAFRSVQGYSRER